MRFVFWFIVGIMLLMIGCASNLRVTYYSDPSGALLYEGEKRFGYTPLTLNYQITKENKKMGYVVLRGTQVRWASGASTSISSLKADLSMGTKQQFNFIRPQNFPRRETDIQFALELEKVRLMREQLEWQQWQTFWQQWQAIWNTPPLNTGIHCTTRRIGNTIYTDCY